MSSQKILNLKEAAEYLHVSKYRLEALIKEGIVPHHMHGEKPIFLKSALGEWASQRIVNFSEKELEKYHAISAEDIEKNFNDKQEELSSIVSPEFCVVQLPGKTRPSIIFELASAAYNTGLVNNKADLIRTLEEREKLGSTGMANGFAVPHPRYHDEWMFEKSFVLVAKAVTPIYWGAKDDNKTDIFFLICSCSDKHHLHLLAKTCVLSMQGDLLEELREAVTEQEMYDAICRAEEKMKTGKKK